MSAPYVDAMKILQEKIYLSLLPARALRALAMALLLLAGALTARALPAATYASSSRLASGYWVKVAVAASGMHVLTDAELRSWGFANPAAVKVYGYGAQRLPEALNASSYIDDLPQTPSEYIPGVGVVFFGEGPSSIGNVTLDYMRPVQNPFTMLGYYFLSDSETSAERKVPAADGMSNPVASAPATTFKELSYHEAELFSPGQVGHLLVGEDFKYNRSQKFLIPLPGIDPSRPVRMEASFVANTLTAPSNITYSLNGHPLPAGNGDRIAMTTDHYFHGAEGLSRKEFTVNAPQAEIGVEYSTASTVTSANLNYIALTYTRALSLDGAGTLVFNANNGNRGFSLSQADGDTRVWDITDPVNATAMNLSGLSGNVRSWSLSRSGYRRYVAWKPSAVFSRVQFAGAVRNQNLHGLEGAEMVIFTPNQWKNEAERIARFHREDAVDPLTVVVLTPQEIYNEFGSGAPDAQAFRKLLKMFYDRQAKTDKPLRYALFMSRPNYDNRSLTPETATLGYPFLPAWFTDRGLYDNDSYTTDDIFAFLKDNSGTNTASDELCIAVGRMPVTSQADAKAAVDKLQRYYNKMPRSNWKNNILVVADDQDKAEHMYQADNYFWHFLTQSEGHSSAFYKKLYTDQYELISNVYEEGRKDFYRYLDEGVMWWTYTGHANPSSLTAEGLVTYSDLNSLYLRHWPVVYAATCDFLRWDSPTVSGAEILFKNPSGGVISAISATRPVYILNNGYLSAAIGRQLLYREADGMFGTVGDILRRAKNDYQSHDRVHDTWTPTSDSNKLRYVLMGDPAMRLALPSYRVVVDRIGGVTLPVADDAEPPTLMARQQTSVEGHIETPKGEPVTDFSGVLTATLYDAEQSITTRGNGSDGEEFTFDQQGGRLFVGNAKVENGRFTLPVQMPSEVVNNYRNAAFNLYAYEDKEGGREGVGVFRDFYVYGTDYDAAPDDVPPTITAFYLNYPTFVSGGEVNNSPMVIAHVTDDRAINLSTAGVGHQMVLSLDGGDKTFNDVADYFTPYTDGTPGGTIAYPLENLAVGAHTLRLRVWDSAPNSTEAELGFFVAKQITPVIYDVYTDANPASVEANFYIIHDRPDRELTVTIEVFDMMGRRLWQATQNGRSDMFQSMPVTWDLTDFGGRRVGRGIYLYRATVSDDYSGEKTATEARRIAVTAP